MSSTSENMPNIENLEIAYDIMRADYDALQTELTDKNNLIQNLYNDLDDISDACKKAEKHKDISIQLQQENEHLKSELNSYIHENNKLCEINKQLETYINSCYKLPTILSVNNTTDNIDDVDNVNSVDDVDNVNIVRYELIPNNIVTDWLIDYINNACTYTSMIHHTLSYEYTHTNGEQLTKKRSFKNNKWTLRIMLKQFFSYFHPEYCKRIYASKDIQNSQCMICYNDVTNPCMLTCNCKYIYCYRCINKWINKQKKNCPCCDSKATLIEAGPLTPIHLKIIIDKQQSLSSIPQYLKILD
jgi:hypothetical protein